MTREAPPPAAAATPDAADAALDADTLARLHALDPGGVARVVERVLRAYEASLLRYLGEAESLHAARDVDGLGRLAHTLKSSSASVGALRLARVCTEIERVSREQGGPVTDAQVSALIHESRAALQAVRAILPS